MPTIDDCPDCEHARVWPPYPATAPVCVYDGAIKRFGDPRYVGIVFPVCKGRRFKKRRGPIEVIEDQDKWLKSVRKSRSTGAIAGSSPGTKASS